MIELNTAHAEPAGHGRLTSMDTLSVLRSAFHASGAKRILDIGCGDGAMAEALASDGFRLTGLDPSASALDLARKRAPSIRFAQGCAEAMPSDLHSFDAACFVNALHHVPSGQMQRALLNAVASVRAGGIVLVIEPLAQGSFFRAMNPVEDETSIRAQAANAIEALISDGRVVLRDLRRWNRESRFTGLDDFIAYLARVMPERAELARQNLPALSRAWRDNIRSIDGMASLVQPMICWTLAAPQQARP